MQRYQAVLKRLQEIFHQRSQGQKMTSYDASWILNCFDRMRCDLLFYDFNITEIILKVAERCCTSTKTIYKLLQYEGLQIALKYYPKKINQIEQLAKEDGEKKNNTPHQVVYLPYYHPEINAIEYAWAQVKPLASYGPTYNLNKMKLEVLPKCFQEFKNINALKLLNHVQQVEKYLIDNVNKFEQKKIQNLVIEIHQILMISLIVILTKMMITQIYEKKIFYQKQICFIFSEIYCERFEIPNQPKIFILHLNYYNIQYISQIIREV